MHSKILRSELMLFLASAIWGFAFVAQRVGMEHVGPFTYNGVRFALGCLSLLPLILVRSHRADRSRPVQPFLNRRTMKLGGIVGLVLFCGASLQQIGIVYTTAGKAGFITGLYVVIVPVLGLFLRQRPGFGTWVGAGIAAAGLYLLSVTGRFAISRGDFLVLCSAFFWAAHVLLIGSLSQKLDTVKLAFTQFVVCSVLSLITALALETIVLAKIINAAIPILYGGILSVGVAYTLQVVAQRHAPPAHAAIILSLETVFAVLGGWLILSETIPFRGLVGCALMLAGIIVSQRSFYSETRARAFAPAYKREQA
jgi:drug/metabolite transporter (DMT)-like permease